MADNRDLLRSPRTDDESDEEEATGGAAAQGTVSRAASARRAAFARAASNRAAAVRAIATVSEAAEIVAGAANAGAANAGAANAGAANGGGANGESSPRRPLLKFEIWTPVGPRIVVPENAKCEAFMPRYHTPVPPQPRGDPSVAEPTRRSRAEAMSTAIRQNPHPRQNPSPMPLIHPARPIRMPPRSVQTRGRIEDDRFPGRLLPGINRGFHFQNPDEVSLPPPRRTRTYATMSTAGRLTNAPKPRDPDSKKRRKE